MNSWNIEVQFSKIIKSFFTKRYHYLLTAMNSIAETVDIIYVKLEVAIVALDFEDINGLREIKHDALLFEINRKCRDLNNDKNISSFIPKASPTIATYSHSMHLILVVMEIIIHLISMNRFTFKEPPGKNVESCSLVTTAVKIAVMVLSRALYHKDTLRAKGVKGNEDIFGM